MTVRLLLIDDDAAARRMMRRVLERRGYRVAEESDGRSGVEHVRSTPPDGILLDLRMPGELSGFDVARELRADATTAPIPIVVVSASAHFDARDATTQIGCDAFIEKPVDFDELDRVLAEIIPAR